MKSAKLFASKALHKIGIATRKALRLHGTGLDLAILLPAVGLKTVLAASVIWKRPGKAVTGVFSL